MSEKHLKTQLKHLNQMFWFNTIFEFYKSYSHNIKTILVVTSDKVYDYDKQKLTSLKMTN